MMADISFIIPSYNSHKTIEQTLHGIYRLQAISRVRDIIIVDSSDDVKTKNILRNCRHEKLKILFFDSRVLAGVARNIGAKESKGNVLCFIDSDVVVSFAWLDHVLSCVQDGLLVGSGSISIPTFQEEAGVARAQLYLEFNEYLPVGVTRSVRLISSSNMFIQKSLFDRANGFPEISASEDTLFCSELVKLTNLWFVPYAHSYHIFRETISAYALNQILLGSWILYYRRKTCSAWFYRGIWPIIFLPGFTLIKLFRIAKRIFYAGGDHFLRFTSCFHLFLLGLFFWATGFFVAAIRKAR